MHGPTFFATQLYEKFCIAISEIEGAIESARKFDPYLSGRRFRLAMSNIREITFLPHLIAAHQKDAGTRVRYCRRRRHQGRGMAERGQNRCGYLRPSYFPVDSAGEVIFTDHYVCLASSRHPRLSSELTMQQYLAERHVLVSPESGHSVVEERLQELGCTHKIALRVPHFSVPPEVIATTVLLLAVPSSMARRFAAQHSVQAFNHASVARAYLATQFLPNRAGVQPCGSAQ
jgi:DNA-binding transcriptional LysR family regulator